MEKRVLPERMISTTVYLEKIQVERLHILQKENKVPIAAYIRSGITMLLNDYFDLEGKLIKK